MISMCPLHSLKIGSQTNLASFNLFPSGRQQSPFTRFSISIATFSPSSAAVKQITKKLDRSLLVFSRPIEINSS